MDEIGTLSQEIEFHEKFRGYDPDEVDAYVDRVRKVAALATGRLEELHHRAEAAEALIAAGRVDSAEEILGRTLLLAQQTADQLVAGAREEAARITAEADERSEALLIDAESQNANVVEQARAQAAATTKEAGDRASRMLAEAETDRREMVRNAEAEAAAVAEDARRKLSADVSTLSATRDFLSDDIDILERHVREQRANLALVVSSLTDLVEQPGAFQLDPTPATSGVVVSATDGASEAEANAAPIDVAESEIHGELSMVHDEAEEVIDILDDQVAAAVEGDGPMGIVEESIVEESIVEESAAEADTASGTAPDSDGATSPELKLVEGPAISIERPSAGGERPAPEDEVINLDQLEADEGAAEQPADVAHVSDPAPPRLVTAADIDPSGQHMEAVDSGPATAPIPAVVAEPLFAEVSASESTGLSAPHLSGLSDGDLLSDDSDALAAFFDQDDDETDRSWFGRRR